MSRVFHDLKVGLDEELEEKLQWLVPDYQAYHILRQSVDARKRHSPHEIYSIEVFQKGEKVPDRHIRLEKFDLGRNRPIIIGAGPAGLFCALRMAERGLRPILLEQGSVAEKRVVAINKFWRYGTLDLRNNVGFGEGGAGLYSDGKLITRIKSPFIAYVMDRLVDFGAPEEIRYLANPHVGSDRIRRLIPHIRNALVKAGCELRFDCKVTALLTEGKAMRGVRVETGEELHSDHVVLATGHSSEDMLHHLRENGIFLEGKSFAMGLRIEHQQHLINKIQYRDFAEHPKLGSANYKLAYHNEKSDYGVYSFCMCPGGYVLSSATEPNRMVVNGMSNYKRNSPFANAAIVVSIDHQKSFGDQLWAGMDLRQQLEEDTYQMAAQLTKINGLQGHEIPVQKLTDFMQRKPGGSLPSSSPSKVVAAPLHDLLPEEMFRRLNEGLKAFAAKMPEFITESAQLHAIESRTSCPVRITRDRDSLESISHSGLYPCGEGAGYAGGITSAACDGIKIAEKITSNLIGKSLEAEA